MSRDARKEVGSPRRKKLSFFVPLPPPSAFSHARGHFCVSRLSLYGLRIKRDGSWSKVCVSNWARPVNWRLNDVSNFSIQGRAITCHQSLPLVDSAKSWSRSCGLLKGLIKQPKNRILPIFSPNFTFNGQIWLFYTEKWVFSKKLGTLLNPFAPGNFTEKRVLKLVERFSGHCRARH